MGVSGQVVLIVFFSRVVGREAVDGAPLAEPKSRGEFVKCKYLLYFNHDTTNELVLLLRHH